MKQNLKISFEPLAPDSSHVAILRSGVKCSLPPALVPRTDDALTAMCYSNVREKIAADGGEAVTGFLLLHWPGVLAEALHHAIWRSPEGALHDITGPAYDGLERFSECWFIPDGRKLGSDDMAIPSWFSLETEDPRVKRWTRAARATMQSYSLLLECPHKSVRNSQGLGQMEFAPSSQADQRIAKLQENRRERDAAFAALTRP